MDLREDQWAKEGALHTVNYLEEEPTGNLLEELQRRGVLIQHKTNFEKILEWHHAFGVNVREQPTIALPQERRELRIKLIEEETEELLDAIAANDLIEIADGIADVLVVTYGTAAEYGINADNVYDEVHRSNMSKMGADGKPVMREDGKILKGPDFFLPNIKEVLGIE